MMELIIILEKQEQKKSNSLSQYLAARLIVLHHSIQLLQARDSPNPLKLHVFFLNHFLLKMVCLPNYGYILDKIILFFIYLHAYANKLVLRGISKLDMYLWRKTGRDTVITNAIWKLQGKYMSRSKKQKKLMTMAFVGAIISYYGWLIVT